MGTRSLTRIMNNSNPDGVPLTCIYRQHDGYLDGHGADLKKSFGDTVLVNGLSRGSSNLANGMGCFAAQVIANLKKEPGGIYVYDPGAENEGFTYTLYSENADDDGMPSGKIKVRAVVYEKVVFEGLLADLPGDSNEDD